MAEFRIQRIEGSNGMVDVRFVPSSATSLTFSAVTSNTYYGDGSNLTGISTIDTYVTGFTFNPTTYDLTLRQNEGQPNLTSNLAVLASDVYVVSGVYNPSTGIVTYTNSSGGTFQVSGFTTGMTDSYTTSANLNGETIEFNNNIQGANLYNVSLTPILSGKTDLSLFNSHTADTNNPHQTSFSNLTSTAHTHTISDVINLQTELDSKLDITNFNTYSGNVQTELSGKIENGINVGGANEIFSGKSGTDLYFRTLSGGSNTTISTVGDVVKVDVTIPTDTNTFVTGFTYNDFNTFTISRNDGVELSALINIMSGLTINGDLIVRDNTTLSGLTTVYGDTPTSAAIRPGLNNTYDLGQPSFRWREIYTTNLDATNAITTFSLFATNNITADNNLVVSGGSRLIGSSTYESTVTGTNSKEIVNVEYLTAYTESNDTFVTGSTVTSNVLELTRNDAQKILQLSGGTNIQFIDNGNNSITLNATSGGGGASVSFPWKFKDPTASADPGTGNFRFNSTIASGITEIYVNDFTNNGIDASNILNAIDTGDLLYIQQNDDASRALLFSISASTIDNTGWFTIPVQYQQGSTLPKKDKICGWILASTGAEDNTASNVGVGQGVFKQKNVNDFEFYSLSGGTNTTLTLNNDTIVFDVTIPPDTNTFVTGFTYDNANTFTISQNNGSNFSASIDTVTGLTSTGSISATTYYGDGSNLTGIVAGWDGLEVITVGENVSQGDLLYLSSGSTYLKASNTSEVTTSTELRIAVENILSGQTGNGLIQGKYTTTGLTAGDQYWVGASNGTYTNIQPSGNGDIVRYVGTALDSTTLEFKPDETWIEISSASIPSTTLQPAIKNVTTSYNLLSTDYTINVTTTGDTTQTLPLSVSLTGKIYNIKNSDSSETSEITIATTGGELIDGLYGNGVDLTIIFPQSLTLQSTGSGWIII